MQAKRLDIVGQHQRLGDPPVRDNAQEGNRCRTAFSSLSKASENDTMRPTDLSPF